MSDIPRNTGLRQIIFDLDGTLVDSAPSILASLDAALQAQGVAPRRALARDLIGPPLGSTLRDLAGDVDQTTLTVLIEHFKADYDGERYKRTEAFDGIGALLARLHASGTELYLATNKRMVPTRKILDLFGWTKFFTGVYALDGFIPPVLDKTAMLGALLRGRGIEAVTAAYVGDRHEDEVAARANDLRFFGVNWGYGADVSQASSSVQELWDALGAA